MSTQPNTAQALWDARDELQEFEQQTQEDGFTVVLAGILLGQDQIIQLTEGLFSYYRGMVLRPPP